LYCISKIIPKYISFIFVFNLDTRLQEITSYHDAVPFILSCIIFFTTSSKSASSFVDDE